MRFYMLFREIRWLVRESGRFGLYTGDSRIIRESRHKWILGQNSQLQKTLAYTILTNQFANLMKSYVFIAFLSALLKMEVI